MEQDYPEELRLRAFDALLWIYHKLYIKDCAGGGINDEEFEELKQLFVKACYMAKNLLRDFVRKYDEVDTDDFDVVLDRAEHWRVLHYADCWKRMYRGLLPCVEEKRVLPDEKLKVISAYDLLKIPNYRLAAWFIMEKENGITGKDNLDLLHKLYFYLSDHDPFRNEYPGISYTTQAEIWHLAKKHDYGDLHPDVWECYVEHFFEDKMEEYMREHGMQHLTMIPSELEERIVFLHKYRLFIPDEIKTCIFSAMKENKTLEIVYFSFENGTSHISMECIMPIKVDAETHYYWTLIGKDEKGQTKEYVVRQILEVNLKLNYNC